MGGASEQKEESRRKAQEVDHEVNRNWTAIYQTIVTNVLSYMDESEALKVNTKELKEQVLYLNEPSVNIERSARREVKNARHLFQILSRRMATWEEHFGNVDCVGE